MIHTHNPPVRVSTERAAQQILTTASYQSALATPHSVIDPYQRAALTLAVANNTHNHPAGHPATITK